VKKKIAIIVRVFSDTSGGAERFCYETTKNLSNNYDITVFCEKTTNIIDNVNFKILPKLISRPNVLSRFIFALMAYFKTRNQFDCTISHSWCFSSDIHVFHVKSVKSRKNPREFLLRFFLSFFRLFGFKRNLYKLLEKSQVKYTKYLLFVSRQLGKQFQDNYQKEIINFLTIYPGIYPLEKPINVDKKDRLSISRSMEFEIQKNDFVILFIGHNFKRKGLNYLLKAVDNINNKSIKVLVIGKDKPVKFNFKNPSICKNVRYLGKVKNINEFYSIADCMVHPTLDDTFGMVVLEALSHSLPVIVSSEKYCGISEKLSKENALILANPKSSYEIEGNILYLKNNPKDSIRIGENGFKLSKEFSWNEVSSKFIKIIDELRA